MDKIFEHANEQHLRGLIVYGNVADGNLYYEPEHVNKANVKDMENAYKKDVLRIDDGTNLLSPVSMVGRTLVTIDGTADMARMTGWIAGEGDFSIDMPPGTGASFVNPFFTKA